ncbi:ribokinase [Tessaracoccus sp. OS52]|uniref:ribokinase n=1 Tax=Tessaracoccus sp. OS52 TaxID=2886691 RepID=UPI001D10316F|nr:ribokinase [Tessaracoccus sp. OS52]
MPTEPAAKVVVLGSYAKALVITADRIPITGETLIGRQYRETFGGKGSDMAVQAARLGAPVVFVGVIGDDNHGREFVQLMSAEGVDTSALRVSVDRPTGVGLIIKDEAGHNIIVVDMGANEEFGESELECLAAVIEPGDVALAQLEIPLAAVLRGLASAHAQGAATVLNPAPASDLRGLDLSFVDYLTPNETEARVALGRDPGDGVTNLEVARELLGLGCGRVVMTLGEQGAAVYEYADGDVVETHVPAWSVATVDSNGAGDSFNAALCTALLEGRPVDDAVRFAAATAALCCTQWETVPSYHSRAQVEEFMMTDDKELEDAR